MGFRTLGLRRLRRWRYVWVFLAGVLLTGTATAFLVRRDYQLTKSDCQARLETIAENRALVLGGYLQSHLVMPKRGRRSQSLVPS